MDIKITWTADAKQAEAEANRMAKANQKLEDQLAKLTGKSLTAAQMQQRMGKITVKSTEEAVKIGDKLGKQQIRLRAEVAKAAAQKQQQAAREKAAARERIAAEKAVARAAKQVFDETRSPQERYIARERELNALLKQKKISHDTYRRAVSQAHQTMIGGAGQATTKVQGWLKSLAGVATGYLSIQTAVRLVTRALQEMARAREEAAQAQRQSFQGIGSLAQLATTPGKMRELLEATEATYAQGVGESMDEAAKLVFQLESAGALRSRELFSELGGKGVVQDPATFAKAAATLRTTMGEKETGSYRAVVSKAFAASGESPAQAPALLEAAAKSGVMAGQLEMSDEEVLAAAALLAKAKGGAETAGTYLAQMFRTLQEKDRFKGKSLKNIVLEIQAEQEGMTGEERKKWWGRAQGREAFKLLVANMDTFEENLRLVREGEATDRVQMHLDLSMMTARQRAAYAQRTQKAKEEQSREKLGVAYNIADAVVNGYAEQRRKEGGSEWEIAFNRMSATTGRWVTGSDQSWLKMIGPDSPYMKVSRAMSYGAAVINPLAPLLQGDMLGPTAARGDMSPELRKDLAGMTGNEGWLAVDNRLQQVGGKLDKLIDVTQQQTGKVTDGNAATRALADEIRQERQRPRPVPQTIDAGAEPVLSW